MVEAVDTAELAVPVPGGRRVRFFREILPGEHAAIFDGALIVVHPTRPPIRYVPQPDGSIKAEVI